MIWFVCRGAAILHRSDPGRTFAAIELAGAAVVISALVANNLYLRAASTRR